METEEQTAEFEQLLATYPLRTAYQHIQSHLQDDLSHIDAYMRLILQDTENGRVTDETRAYMKRVREAVQSANDTLGMTYNFQKRLLD